MRPARQLIWLILPLVCVVIIAMAYWDNWGYRRFVRRLLREGDKT